MKAFITGVAGVILIGVVAAVALDMLGWSSAQTYTTSNVRL